VVTGKGGVGKTTVAAALGIVAARRGLRTVVAEVAARDDVSRALGADGHGGVWGPMPEAQLADGLHHVSIDPQSALEEYLAEQLPGPVLADLLARSRLFTYLTAATPGMRELLSVGKVWELAQDARRTPGAQPYDVVVLDAPATGHGVAILEAPRTFAEVARVGPINRQGTAIDRMLSDPARTGVVVVARAEEMPVNETLALEEALRERMGLAVGLIVVDGVLPDRFSRAETAALRGIGAHPAAAVALETQAQARGQQAQLERLRRGTSAPVVRLPFVHAAALGPPELETLAGCLERAL
jgi:anion-transporting  ArsA/GET3 family ATPase